VLGHAVGARHGIENGIVNAIVLPHALRFNAAAARAGLSKVATGMGLAERSEPLGAVVDAVGAMLDALGAPRRLRDVGVSREALADVAAKAMGDWFLRGNPRPVRDASELLQLLGDAL
jgi:alcohol dehydrogenase class IV